MRGNTMHEENRGMETGRSSDLRQDMIRILDCLLNSEGRKCESCKKCEDVDVCCFLTDAVIVYKHRGRKRTDSVL